MRNKLAQTFLIIIFFASGFSSLIYQVAWQRILTLYYSVENISTTLIVSVYMLGLGLGAIVGGYLADRIENKLKFYLCIELLIGLFGCISIPFLEFLGRSTAGSNYLVSFFYMFAFLCVPTFLMGITLPLLTKIFNSLIDNFMHSLSYLYFINTMGAALGTLVSSYVLISFYGLDISVYIAATINLLIAAFIFLILKRYPSTKTEVVEQKITSETTSSFSNYKIIYLIVFVTGFIAIGYEIIWFRIIGTIVKASPYAFSSVLFVFLLGIALGSYFMKKFLSNRQQINKKNLFYIFQFSIAAFTLLSISLYYFLIKDVTVFSGINAFSFEQILHPKIKMPSLHSARKFFWDVFIMFDVFIWPLVLVFVPTLFMGASFPLITSIAFKDGKEGDAVGKVYFFNVLGNVTGGLITGLILLNVLGTEYSILFLSFIGLVFIYFVESERKLFRRNGKLLMVFSLILFAVFFFPKRYQLYNVIHPEVHFAKDERKIINEGLDGVVVTYSEGEKLTTYINGMSHGGRPISLFYYEAIEALSYNKEVKDVLIIGFGTGSTLETILKLNPKPKVDLVELNKTLIENLNHIDYLNGFLNDAAVNLMYADGRKYLYNTEKKYDAIFIDPLRTSTSFSNNLYSKQFFELINQHLNPGGVFMVWMDEHHVVPKTVSSVFSFVNQYSFFCVASNRQLKEDESYKSTLIKQFPNCEEELVKINKRESHPFDKPNILSNNAGFPINEDYRPKCEYYIGL